MQQSVSILDRKEVALHLNALVTTAIAGILSTDIVSMTRQFLGQLRVVPYPDIPRIHRVFQSEGTLELSYLDLELRVFPPFEEEILHVKLIIIGLHLKAIGEIAEYRSIDIEADKALRKTIVAVLLPFLVGIGEFLDEVTANLRHGSIIGKRASQLLVSR